jgi:hypothetical protein
MEPQKLDKLALIRAAEAIFKSEYPDNRPALGASLGKTMNLNEGENINWTTQPQTENSGKTIKEQSPDAEDATTNRVVADGPHRAEEDLREAPELSDSHSAAGTGKTMIGRTLSIRPLSGVTEIWKEAERRLVVTRSHFVLVIGDSRYLLALCTGH